MSDKTDRPDGRPTEGVVVKGPTRRPLIPVGDDIITVKDDVYEEIVLRDMETPVFTKRFAKGQRVAKTYYDAVMSGEAKVEEAAPNQTGTNDQNATDSGPEAETAPADATGDKGKPKTK